MSEEMIYKRLLDAGLTETAACAMLANWYWESGLRGNNAEDCLTLTDVEYTKAVDEGRITSYEFMADDIGYGLAQWTFPERKRALLTTAKAKNVSVSDLEMQVEFAINEIKRDFAGLYKFLCNTDDLYEATYRICYEYENPAIKNVVDRYNTAKEYYKRRETKLNIIEKYTQEAEAIARDNSHGYSQANRNGNPDYDCSSLVNAVVDRAGIPVKSHGASYTGNMYSAYLACGFKDVIREVDVSTGRGLQRGDILLNKVNHVAIYEGNGQIVHARSNDGHPEPGDQSGREIVAGQSYYNYPWDAVLRYMKGDSMVLANENGSAESAPVEKKNNKYYPEIIKMGDIGEEVRQLQDKLNIIGFECGPADGEFGPLTQKAVVAFQEAKNLLVDGEVGPETFAALASYTAPDFNAAVKVGETVEFTGGMQYLMANSIFGTVARAGKATVTAIRADAKHPYHLVKTYEGTSNVYGWVDAGCVKK